METNAVNVLADGIATGLGSTLDTGLSVAADVLGNEGYLSNAQTAISAVLLMFVGMAALFYVGRWLYKAFKRGAA